LDDHNRFNFAARLYASETLLARLDFLGNAFQVHGLSLEVYVDYHSFFLAHPAANGDITVLKGPPVKNKMPIVLLSNRLC
jgi:hypothetical protein